MKRIDQATELLKQAKQNGREIIMERIGGQVLLSDTYFLIREPGDNISAKQWAQLMKLFTSCEPGEAVRVYKDHTRRQTAFINDYANKFKREATARVSSYETIGQTGQHINKATGHTVTEYQVNDEHGGEIYLDAKYSALLHGRPGEIMTKPGEPVSWGSDPKSLRGGLAEHFNNRDNLRVRRSALVSSDDETGAVVVVLPLAYDPKDQKKLARVTNYELWQAVQNYGPVLFRVKGQDPNGRRWTRDMSDPWNLNPDKASIYAQESALHAAGLTRNKPSEPDKWRRVARVVEGVLLANPNYYKLIQYQTEQALDAYKQHQDDQAQAARFGRDYKAPADELRDEIQARGYDSGRVIVGTIKGGRA